MRRSSLSFLFLLFTFALARAQGPPPTSGYVTYQGFAPSGVCNLPNNLTVATVGSQAGVYQCKGVPLTWTLVGDGSSVSGVSSIDTLTGAFTFGGPGVSHIGQAYTFSGSGTGIGSIAWVLPSWLTPSPGTISASGTQTFNPTTAQTTHQVIGTCGTNTTFAPCTLVAGDIPALPYIPTATQLPITIAPTSHNFLTGYTSGTGLFTAGQPNFTDLSGTLGTSQGPSSITGIVWDTGGALRQAAAGTDFLAPNGSAVALSQASSSVYGVAKCDGTTITCASGVFAAVGGGAVTTVFGRAGTVVAATNDYNFNQLAGALGTTQGPVLTGILKDTAGTLSVATPGTDYLLPNGSSAALSQATSGAFGVVKPDGTTCTVSSGILTCPGSGGGITALTGDATASGSGSVPVTVVRINGTSLAGLATGLLKNTTGTGVPSIATPGTDYLSPTGSAAALTSFPTFNQNTTGTAAGLSGNQTANFVYAGPASGAAAAATFRALVSLDIPNNAANTTGSAATLTTPRTLAGNSFNGSANVPFTNKFIVQGTTDAGLTGAQFLGALATGPLCNTTTTGVLSICGASSSSWSALTNPSANLALTMAANTSIYTYNAATGSSDLFGLTDTASNTGTGIMLHTHTQSGSTEIPFQADVNGVGWQVAADGSLKGIGSGASHGWVVPAGTPLTPVAASAVYTSDSSGNSSLSENGGATSRICTVGNALCAAGGAEVVTFSATPTFSVVLNTSRIVLTNNITSFTLGTGTDGQNKTLCFKQGAGPFTVAAPANVHGFFTVGVTNATWNCQSFNYDLTDSIWLATTSGVLNQ